MTQLMRLLPTYWQDSPEMRELQNALGGELDELAEVVDNAYLDARVMTASAERLTEWEKDIGLASEGRELNQRRQFILSLLRGSGKLNEAKINGIVNAFTGGRAIVSFKAGTLTVKVLAPGLGETYHFPDVKKALSVRMPAHLTLDVVRYYATWGDIQQALPTWGDIKNGLADWAAVKNYIKE